MTAPATYKFCPVCRKWVEEIHLKTAHTLFKFAELSPVPPPADHPKEPVMPNDYHDIKLEDFDSVMTHLGFSRMSVDSSHVYQLGKQGLIVPWDGSGTERAVKTLLQLGGISAVHALWQRVVDRKQFFDSQPTR